MAELAQLRLVWCPKCQGLLPELADYSLYTCGGCGAVLQARHQNDDSDALSERLDEERGVGFSTESQSQSSFETGNGYLTEAYDTDKSDMATPNFDVKDENPLTEARRELGNGDCHEADPPREEDDLGNSEVTENDGSKSASGFVAPSVKPKHDQVKGVQRTTEFSSSNISREDLANSTLEPDRVGGSANDAAELLKKLEELKEQLMKPHNVSDESRENYGHFREKTTLDPCYGLDTCLQGGSSGSDAPWMPSIVPHKNSSGHPCFNHLHHHPHHDPHHHGKSFLCCSGNQIPMPNCHLPPDHPWGSQMMSRNPQQLHGQFSRTSHQLCHGPCFDHPPCSVDPYIANSSFQQPSCSCLLGDPLTMEPPLAFPKASNSHLFYHQDHKPGVFPPPPPSKWNAPVHGSCSHFWSNDGHLSQKASVRSSGGRGCHPIAYGAPFLTCINCFELLELPKNVFLMPKRHSKIRCGACSIVIDLSLVNNKLVLSANHEPSKVPYPQPHAGHGSDEMVKEEYTMHSHGNGRPASTKFSSQDYDKAAAICDFDTKDADLIPSFPADLGSNSECVPETKSVGSSPPPLTLKDDNSDGVLLSQRNAMEAAKPAEASLSPPPAGSSLQQHFNCSSNNHVGNHSVKENWSGRSDQEKTITTTRQNSLTGSSPSSAAKNSPPHRNSSNKASQDDSEDEKEKDDGLNSKKGTDSFLATMIKRRLKDFTRFNESDNHRKGNVSVNGHVIPYRLVKKAEKLAGPIHPGQYWYDYGAGFWGVMGGPCLGIIPPFIDEFKSPMPKNCAGGSTAVFVNGRELHQNDLRLLARRGLATERGRRYLIDLSGNVVDEVNGRQLECLGKLAPTVERAKRGFGMKVPKAGQ